MSRRNRRNTFDCASAYDYDRCSGSGTSSYNCCSRASAKYFKT
jgi:hypothetical protein